MKFAGWYSIVVGVLMLAQWAFFLATGQVPELQTAPVALGFHLVAEGVTAVMLVVSGNRLLRQMPGGHRLDLIALGMLTYTIIVSAGYFAQQGTWMLVMMFGALLVLTLACILQLTQPKRY